MARIGFVGLGHMGLPMALNLLKAGHQVIGFDLQRSALQELAKGGGQPADSLAYLAKNSEVLITMLQTGNQVNEVCLGSEGLFPQLRSGMLYMDCSTIDVPSSQDIHAKAQEYGIKMVDAPVSGGVAAAKAATLTFMVGGEAPVFKAAENFLKNMGKTVIHTGEAGSGQAAKICNNLILGVSMIAVSEAFILAQKLGLAPQKLFEVVSNSSGQCWVMSKYVPVPGILDNVPANNEYQPGFTAAMMLKDLKLSQQSARTAHLETPMAAKATKLYQALVKKGLGDLDFSAIIKTLDLAD